jgi:hypothetical protein
MKEPKRMSLGTYPEVSLREARALRDEARALVAKDINPRLHRKQKRAAVKLAGENTFEAIYKWLAHRERGLKKGRQTTLSILPRVFAKDVLPLLGKRSIYDIKRPDLLEVIARIERRKALSVAEKVRTWFNQMFRYALVVVPGLEQNGFRPRRGGAAAAPVNHNRSCAWPSCRSCCSACASIAAGCRPSSVCGCCYSPACARASCAWRRRISSTSIRASGSSRPRS